MHKRIAVTDLRVGMHVKKFCGSWMDHPFWRSGFVLDNEKDLQLILASAIKEVWIDTDLGADVGEDAEAADMIEFGGDEEILAAELRIAPPPPRDLAPVPASEEFARAAAICNSARGAVTSMFQDARMGRAIDQEVARQVVEDIADSVTRNAGALISLARLKTADDYTYMHSVAVCALMIALARQLGLEDERVRAAGFAGLLHDVGKMDIPLEILNKPGKLTDEEYQVVRNHPRAGFERLKASGMQEPVALDVCLHHHEKVDGTGYPFGLSADRLSLEARMGAICDVYDAITSNRPYKAGWDPAESLKRMAQWAGHFDSRIFQAFVRSLCIYPVGSLVLMSSGKLAVVVDQTPASLLKPIVKTVFSTKSMERTVPELIDLSAPGCKHRILGREDPEKWKIPNLDELWSGIQR